MEAMAISKQLVEPGQVTWGSKSPGFDRGWGKNPAWFTGLPYRKIYGDFCMVNNGEEWDSGMYPLVMTNIIMEHHHWNSGFSHESHGDFPYLCKRLPEGICFFSQPQGRKM